MINDICVLHYFQDFAAISEDFSLTVSFYFTHVVPLAVNKNRVFMFRLRRCYVKIGFALKNKKTSSSNHHTNTHTVSQANLHLTHCFGYGYVDIVDTSTTVNHVLFWDISYSESNEFLHACARIWILSCSATYSPR